MGYVADDARDTGMMECWNNGEAALLPHHSIIPTFHYFNLATRAATESDAAVLPCFLGENPVPIFEYQCRQCNHEFEILLRGEEKPRCPTCGGAKLDKLLSVPAAHTSSSSGSELPICGAPGPDACGMGQCGSGSCPLE
jgi:putative FmdB family regulatory protein